MNAIARTFLAACAAVAAVGLAIATPEGRAPQGHGHGPVMSASQLAALRGATARFQRIEAAMDEGYEAFGGCFESPSGDAAMGYHYVNSELVADPAVDPLRPELLVYEKLQNGKMRLVALEWITFVAAWHEHTGTAQAPALFGQAFHVNPTLLDEPFYLLHAWAWKQNPAGLFADYNPNVRCD
jgi:hypothetical protein